MNFYSAYNLCIASEIPLPDLPPSQNKNYDVIVKLEPINKNHRGNDNNSSTKTLGSLKGLAKVKIEDGKVITIEPLAGIGKSRLSASIINGCMAVILRQRGYLVLHASSVVVNDNVVAFMGESGAGKSTLAAFFAEKGYQVLTDDVMAINLQNNQCLVIPSYPTVKLRKNSVQALYKDKSIQYEQEFTSKFSYVLNSIELEKTFILKKIYVLAIDNYHHIDPLNLQQGFIELLKNTRAIKLLTGDSFISNHLNDCSKILSSVGVSKFYRKPGFDEFSKSINLIKQDLELKAILFEEKNI